MHKSTIAKLCVPDWKFGWLCNVNKFPLEHDTNSEPIQLGLCMSAQDFLHIGLWGFMDNLVVMSPPKPLQVGLGYKEPEPVQVQRYHMVLQFIGGSIVAKQRLCCKMPLWGPGSINSGHPHLIEWGALRTDLDLLGD